MASVYAEGTGFRVDHLQDATSFWGRFRGLMLRRDLPAGSGLRLEPGGSIHMFFMRFPIDAVFYTREGVVTHVARNVRPWIGMARGRGKTRGVIELPAGAADGLEPGAQLIFEGE
jgi:uncharacterized membrane protein (UPF0127 family)